MALIHTWSKWTKRQVIKHVGARGLSSAKFILEFNSMERQGGHGSPAAIFWGGCTVRVEVPNLGQRSAEPEKMKKLRAQAWECDDTEKDKKNKGENTTFEVGDMIRYFDGGFWSHIGGSV